MDLSKTHMSKIQICSKCYGLYGPWSHDSRVLYQKCRCQSKEDDAEWEGFDFNEVATLCHCCGQKLLRSGSKWSVWFCEVCKEKVIEFNTQYQKTIIPIGRHSIMAGYKLSGKESVDENKVHEFMTNLNSLFQRIDILEEWRVHIVSHNLKLLGYSKDITLVEYFSKVKSPPERSIALRDMCEFFMVKLSQKRVFRGILMRQRQSRAK